MMTDEAESMENEYPWADWIEVKDVYDYDPVFQLLEDFVSGKSIFDEAMMVVEDYLKLDEAEEHDDEDEDWDFPLDPTVVLPGEAEVDPDAWGEQPDDVIVEFPEGTEIVKDVLEQEPSEETPEPVVWKDRKQDVKNLYIKVVNYGVRQRIVQRFPSTTQYLDYTFGPCEIPEYTRFSRKNRGHQTFGQDWKAAKKMAETGGWKEGIEFVEKLSARVKKILVGKIALPEVQYDVTGENIDMGKFVAGEPEEWMTMVDSAINVDAKPPKIVHIVTTIDIAQSAEAFLMRGAAVCALTQVLELHGIRVQVDAHIGSNDIIDTWVRVKNAGESINLENMVFFTAHPSMFWILSYACWEQLPEEWRRNAGWLATKSMGWISEPVDEERGDVYISAINSRFMASERSILEFVTAELKKFGIEIDLGAEA